MKIYIAGKITGLDNYKEIFKAAEDELLAQGHQVMSPAYLGSGFPYSAYMPICLSMIDACDAVYMLDNWTDSTGAKLERHYAVVQGKEIIDQIVGFEEAI